MTIDPDSWIVPVFGRSKQGAAFGYTKVRGYHPRFATCVSTAMVLSSRLRGGSAGAARGAKGNLGETVSRVRPTPGSQLALFTTWDYHASSNSRPGDVLEIEADNRRHPVVEQRIAELKSAGLAHLPSGKFMANVAWLALAVMAHNLGRAVGRLAGHDLEKWTNRPRPRSHRLPRTHSISRCIRAKAGHIQPSVIGNFGLKRTDRGRRRSCSSSALGMLTADVIAGRYQAPVTTLRVGICPVTDLLGDLELGEVVPRSAKRMVQCHAFG